MCPFEPELLKARERCVVKMKNLERFEGQDEKGRRCDGIAQKKTARQVTHRAGEVTQITS